MRKSSRLILALDETDKSKALAIAGSVAGLVDAIKINWPLVLSAGPEIITELSKFSDVICDFKVADIPNTVHLIVEGSVNRGAAAVIVHAFPGSDSLEEAVKTAGDRAVIYAVTEMSHPGGKEFTAPNAEALAQMGVRCGVAGFIAPATRPERIAAIRPATSPPRRLPRPSSRPAPTTSSWAGRSTRPRTPGRSPSRSAKRFRACSERPFRGPCSLLII